MLRGAGYTVQTAGTGEDGVELAPSGNVFDVILSDMRMPGISGIDVLQPLRELARRLGLHRHDRLRHRRHGGRGDEARRGGLRAEAVLPRRAADARPLGGGSPRSWRGRSICCSGRSAARTRSTRCIGDSEPHAARSRTLIGRAAAAPGTVLVTGETGTGKELVARALHARAVRARRSRSSRSTARRSTDSLLENELFGHARGAFTGAAGARAGLIEHATGGTLFLDEIGTMPAALQAKLLRALEAGEVRRIGENDARTSTCASSPPPTPICRPRSTRARSERSLLSPERAPHPPAAAARADGRRRASCSIIFLERYGVARDVTGCSDEARSALLGLRLSRATSVSSSTSSSARSRSRAGRCVETDDLPEELFARRPGSRRRRRRRLRRRRARARRARDDRRDARPPSRRDVRGRARAASEPHDAVAPDEEAPDLGRRSSRSEIDSTDSHLKRPRVSPLKHRIAWVPSFRPIRVADAHRQRAVLLLHRCAPAFVALRMPVLQGGQSGRPSMQSATVLIVEDDRELQQRLVAQTRGHGYTALAAATVADAVGALESAVDPRRARGSDARERVRASRSSAAIKDAIPEARSRRHLGSDLPRSRPSQSYELNVFALRAEAVRHRPAVRRS